jgi:hypothetical protein
VRIGTYVHLVFSEPPDGVSDAEYNDWYDAHVQEILAVDGWISARRYRIDAVVGAASADGYRYLSLYELDRPPAEAIANLEAAGMGSADSYIDTKQDDAGRLPLPEWFSKVRFGSWNCTQVGDRITSQPEPEQKEDSR